MLFRSIARLVAKDLAGLLVTVVRDNDRGARWCDGGAALRRRRRDGFRARYLSLTRARRGLDASGRLLVANVLARLTLRSGTVSRGEGTALRFRGGLRSILNGLAYTLLLRSYIIRVVNTDAIRMKDGTSVSTLRVNNKREDIYTDG